MNNLDIQTCVNNLQNVITQSKLPVGVIYLIVQNLYNEVAQLYKEQLMVEQSQLQQSINNDSSSIGQE